MHLYKKDRLITLAIVLTILTGCGGGGSGNSTIASDGSSESSIISNNKVSHSGQIKDSTRNKGLANVIVSLGKYSTNTDENGFYTLSGLGEAEETIVTFEKEGYLQGSKQIQLKYLAADNTTASNYIEYSMYTYDYQWDYNSNEAILSPRIAIDASVSYVDNEGEAYDGSITASLTILDNDDETLMTAFPGTFKGINSNGTLVQFETYGLIHISLKDINHNILHFANNETGTLIFQPTSTMQNINTLPLWYYDYVQGVWIEEGYVELQADGNYKGEISHLGSWSLNKPLEKDPGIFHARILDADGAPARDMRVHAIGSNWASSDLSTDENGFFTIEVIPDSNFKLQSYDFKEKYQANYGGTISAIASGDIVE